MSTAILLSKMTRDFRKPWFSLHCARNLGSAMHGTSTVLLAVGFRHGNRNPARFLNQKSKITWGSAGELALNEIGKDQARSLGDCVSRFLKGYCDPDKIDFYSSSAERCMETMEIVKSRLGYNAEMIVEDDKMLRMYAVDHSKNEEVWRPVSSPCTNDLLPEIQKDLSRRQDLVDYLRKKTGWEMTVADIADLADNFEQMKKFNEVLPAWLETPELCGYDKSLMLKEIATFSEYSQIACSRYGPCRDHMTEHWLSHMGERIEAAKKECSPVSVRTTVAMFSTHTEVVLSMMSKLGLGVERVPTSGGFVAEIRITEREGGRLRLFELSPDPDGHGHTIVNATQSLPDEWIRFESWYSGKY